MCNYKDILNFEKYYQISDTGEIKSLKRTVISPKGKRVVNERILRQFIHPMGYCQVILRKNGKDYRFQVHRLVAIAFIPNPEKKLTVNHINGIKTDNRVQNLEWATMTEQIVHAYSIGLKSMHKTILEAKKAALKNRKSVIQILHNGDTNIYPSIKIASDTLKIPNSNISRALKTGLRAGGYVWIFA